MSDTRANFLAEHLYSEHLSTIAKGLVARFPARTFVLLTDLSTSVNLIYLFVSRETLIHKKSLAFRLGFYYFYSIITYPQALFKLRILIFL